MAGTRTAPTVNGTGNFRRVSIKYVDVVGKDKSTSMQFAATMSDAEIEAVVAAFQDMSNGSVYEVEVHDVYSGDKDQANAEAGIMNTVFDVLTITAKDTVNNSRRYQILAPDEGMYLAGSLELDPTDAALNAGLTAIAAGLEAGMNIISARTTQKRDIGETVPL